MIVIFQKLIATLIGSLLLGVGVNGFLVPHHLIDGGIVGIALLLHYFLKFPTGIIMVGLSIPICIFSSLNNKEYFFSSLQGLLVSSLFIDLLAPLRFQFFIPQLASALIGGAIIGVGVGLMLRYKTSTGGTDLLAEIISETFSLNIALVIILIDGVIVLAGLALLKLDAFLYSCIAIIAVGFITSLIKGK
ncbi:YitT family protein [Caldifermentibacillus hisashii]|uniref:YitT family protein n=1 Tax=Bacillaceae TaxID=186817 RepID=UPI000AD51A66|nr:MULTISPECIES: YitT family protein [Bacillaceae]MCM3800215.1 YitT family protein [Caldibacillus thermoamylovorans]MEC5273882.1 YitT family protein [Caldifermentibacillus hisashii]